MTQASPDDRIVFLAVPPSLSGGVAPDEHSGFCINPDIPIPAEIPEGESSLDLHKLSWEMILSGMIKTVANHPEHEHANYYRAFVVSVRPKILSELTEAAILKSRNGDFALADEILRSVGALFPQSSIIQLNQALVLEEWAEAEHKRGNEDSATDLIERARLLYELLCGKEEVLPDALFNAGFFWMKYKDFSKARSSLERYMDCADNPDKRKKAKAIVKDIQNQDLEDSLYQEAWSLLNQNKEKEALEKIYLFLSEHPQVWNGWFLLGWTLRRLQEWEKALTAFEKAEELGGSTIDLLNESAICCMELNQLDAAIARLEKALRTDCENIKILSNLGIVELKRGNPERAAAFFRTALEIEPNDELSASWLRSLEAHS
jgi:tetratricopeptide (TPR) repeat protein